MSRIKGSTKTGGAVVGSVQTQTADVKRAILKVFNAVNQDDAYLNDLADTDRKLFLSLVARILPTEVAVEQTVKFDLANAMQIAANNSQRMAAEQIANSPAPVIDMTPELVTPDTKPQPPLIDERVLPQEAQAAVTDDRWPGYD